jgi:peptidoglycan/LPS O-acetylase OafA/YrhL
MFGFIAKFTNNRELNVIAQFYLVWFLMNVAIGLMPIFSDVLDGKGFTELFPSLVLVFVVLIASSSHMFLKQKDVPLPQKSVKFSFTMVWIIILVIVSSKYPVNKDTWSKYEILNIPAIPFIAAIISLISIVLSAFNMFPEIESDGKSAGQEQKIANAIQTTKEQNLGDFSKGGL